MAVGPLCGKRTHALCVVGCVRPPEHPGKCRCIHDQPAPDHERNGDER